MAQAAPSYWDNIANSWVNYLGGYDYGGGGGSGWPTYSVTGTDYTNKVPTDWLWLYGPYGPGGGMNFPPGSYGTGTPYGGAGGITFPPGTYGPGGSATPPDIPPEVVNPDDPFKLPPVNVEEKLPPEPDPVLGPPPMFPIDVFGPPPGAELLPVTPVDLTGEIDPGTITSGNPPTEGRGGTPPREGPGISGTLPRPGGDRGGREHVFGGTLPGPGGGGTRGPGIGGTLPGPGGGGVRGPGLGGTLPGPEEKEPEKKPPTEESKTPPGGGETKLPPIDPNLEIKGSGGGAPGPGEMAPVVGAGPVKSIMGGTPLTPVPNDFAMKLAAIINGGYYA
ncbi:MAG TPA: hypothetical protein VF077_00405 [Nitrospiraceae bacterium]